MCVEHYEWYGKYFEKDRQKYTIFESLLSLGEISKINIQAG